MKTYMIAVTVLLMSVPAWSGELTVAGEWFAPATGVARDGGGSLTWRQSVAGDVYGLVSLGVRQRLGTPTTWGRGCGFWRVENTRQGSIADISAAIGMGVRWPLPWRGWSASVETALAYDWLDSDVQVTTSMFGLPGIRQVSHYAARDTQTLRLAAAVSRYLTENMRIRFGGGYNLDLAPQTLTCNGRTSSIHYDGSGFFANVGLAIKVN